MILGGGFCGLQTAKKLAGLLDGNKEYQIVLVNKRVVHVYHADLYEISTAYNKRITEACLSRLKKSVCVEIHRALMGLDICFLHDIIDAIDPQKKTVSLRREGELPYEYLVLALGSVINYYDIPGLQENCYPLKTLEDALALNCHVDQFFRERWQKKEHGKVNIAVGGGGLTGVEYACELVGYVKKLAKKYRFNRKNVEISIIQGGPEFGGLGGDVSQLCFERFKQLGVKAYADTRILGYDGKNVELDTKGIKKSMPAEILIWAGGITINPLLKNFPILHPSGGMEVYPTLESPHCPKVYAGGDNAAIFNPDTHALTTKMAQFAVQQGKTIAYNIWADITGNKQKIYRVHVKGYFLALGGKYFALKRKNYILKGIIPYIMHRIHEFIYFSKYMPLNLSFKRLKQQEEIFEQND